MIYTRSPEDYGCERKRAATKPPLLINALCQTASGRGLPRGRQHAPVPFVFGLKRFELDQGRCSAHVDNSVDILLQSMVRFGCVDDATH